eukprot:scaffold304205_cov89-Cyclotella_meneghiniana.AAC.1
MILSKAIAVLVATILSGNHGGIGGIGLVQSSPVADADAALVEEEISGSSMGTRHCLDSRRKLYAYVLRFGSAYGRSSDCLEYCLQDKVNLVGIEIKPGNNQYCYCLYSGGMGSLAPSAFEPPISRKADPEWRDYIGKGVVKYSDNSKDHHTECYPLKKPTFPAPKPAPRPRPSPSFPSIAVVNWKNSINAKEVDTKADIPSACLDNYYDVELKGVANDKDGAHFFLSASIPKGEKTTNDHKGEQTTNDEKKCPQFLAFASRDEKKRIYHVPDFGVGNGYKYSSYLFGKVTLKAIIDAESSVEPVQDKDYDLTSNSCIHYAGRIWRALRFDETKELANFLVENLLENDGFLTIARQKYSAGGLRVLSFVTGKGSFENFVKDTVYSQLNIKDVGEYSIGENSDIIASVYE